MNFIKHLKEFFSKTAKDERLSPAHICLYMALFLEWNYNHFAGPFQINRRDLMKRSKIGSLNTYYKCMKDLNGFQYIRYEPQYNPNVTSTVQMCRFDIAEPQKTIQSDIPKMIPHSIKINTAENIAENIRSINIKQNTKRIENENREREHTCNKKNKKIKNDNDSAQPTNLEEVSSFFLEKGGTTIDAQKFFNYFESNGWKVGGKTPMKKWKAAASNWMLNTPQFTKHTKTALPSIQFNNDKDYSIPL